MRAVPAPRHDGPVEARAPVASTPTATPGTDVANTAAAAALEDAWRSITTEATLTVETDPGARPLEDRRIVAAVGALLHAAVARGAATVVVRVAADGTVRVHDDAPDVPLRPGVLTVTAEDALSALGASLRREPSDRLPGTRCTVVRPAGEGSDATTA